MAGDKKETVTRTMRRLAAGKGRTKETVGTRNAASSRRKREKSVAGTHSGYNVPQVMPDNGIPLSLGSTNPEGSSIPSALSSPSGQISATEP